MAVCPSYVAQGASVGDLLDEQECHPAIGIEATVARGFA